MGVGHEEQRAMLFTGNIPLNQIPALEPELNSLGRERGGEESLYLIDWD